MSERAHLPEGLLEEIVEARAYERAVAANANDPKTCDQSPLRRLAMDLTFELAQEEIARR